MWLEESGMKCKYLIHDRDTSLIALASVLKAQKIKIIKTPVHSPVCNCFAERFVREVRETLDKMIIFGDKHFIKILKCIEKYHNNYRPHQGLDNHIPEEYDYPETETKSENVRCMHALGGLLKHYYSERKAA